MSSALLEAEGYPLGRFARLDARGGAVTPGLVDPHTHLLFAGSREGELELRQRGAGYLEILAAGGGILSTVAATRAASAEDSDGARPALAGRDARPRGHDDRGEVRLRAGRWRPSSGCIDVAHELGQDGPVDVVPTYLGAHAVPPEFRDAARTAPRRTSAPSSTSSCPASRPMAARASATCSARRASFTADQSRADPARPPRPSACRRGCTPTSSCPRAGPELAAEIGASSADHLAAPSDAGDRRPRGRGRRPAGPVVATLLPATTWFLMKDHHAPARTFIERGVPVAIGTDFNPGHVADRHRLPLAMTAACLDLRMTPDEVAGGGHDQRGARVGLGDEIGSLEAGKAADFVIWNVPTSRQIPYWPAADLVRTVVKRGRIVVDKG